MPQFETTTPPSTNRSPRTIVEHHVLPSASPRAPGGVSLNITKAPHRNGNPEHFFYEAWFQWDGGTLRSSTAIHDDYTREAVSDFIADLTDVEHGELITTILKKYDWNQNKESH